MAGFVKTAALGALFFAQFSFFAAAEKAPDSRHVVLVVWDGMRAGDISKKNTPVLWKLAHEGVLFRHHHSVYPTATNVNGTVLATGAFPGRSGVIANREFRPSIDPRNSVDTAELSTITKGDSLAKANGKFLAVPTLTEIVRAAGGRTAVAGSKSVAFLFDRHAEWASALAADKPLTVFAGAPIAPAARDEFHRLFGPFLSDPKFSNGERNLFTTRALTEFLWRDGLPELSVLWLSEPDLTQHEFAPDTPQALAAIKSSDDCLGHVLAALDKTGARATTDIMVVSDHGFSMISRANDLRAELRAAGFDVLTAFPDEPRRGQILAVGNGGTVLYYVVEHDPDLTARLVEWLQHHPATGVIFSRAPAAGTFPLSLAHLESAETPDVMVAFRWNADHTINADWSRPAGHGTHATLHDADVHNLGVANGPHFQRGFLDELPTSNLDIAPTILRLLELEGKAALDGRVLDEALAGKNGWTGTGVKIGSPQARRAFADGEWSQQIQISTVRGHDYLDFGNGEFKPAH